MEDKELVPAFQSVLNTNEVNIDDGKVKQLVPIIKPRIDFIHEVWEESWFFFKAPDFYDQAVVKKRWKEDTPGKMELLAKTLEQCEPFTAESVETVVKALITSNEWGMGAIMNAWRLLLVGAAKGPGLFDLAYFIGRDEVISRMKNGMDAIGKQ